MLDDIPPFLRELYVARRRACIQEANDIAAVLGLDPVRTEAEWRRRTLGPNGTTGVGLVVETITIAGNS